MLLKYSRKPHGTKDEMDRDRFLDFIDHHVAVEVEYCPCLMANAARSALLRAGGASQ